MSHDLNWRSTPAAGPARGQADCCRAKSLLKSYLEEGLAILQVPVHAINCFPTGEIEGRGLSRSDVIETHDGNAHATGSAAQDQSSRLEKVDSWPPATLAQR